MPLISLAVKREPDDDCLKCGLFKTCQTPIMNFSGPDDAVWKFVGEVGGADEDLEGEPFVGRAGKFLKKIIAESGIPLDKCSFTNSIRCRPLDNDLKTYPKAWEYCKPKILREIHVTKPKVVILLGAVALKSVLNKNGVTKLHGETFQDDEHNRVYLVCLHPSYILRTPTAVNIQKFIDAIQLAASLGGVKTKHSKSHSVKKTKTITITDGKMLQECTAFLRKQKVLATDIEGATLSAFHPRAALGCVGFAPEFGYAIIYPVHARVGWEKKIKIKPEEMVEAVKDIWQDKNVEKNLHFGKYDEGYVDVLHGFTIKNYKHDTGLLSYAYDITKGIHGLKDWMLRLGGDAYWDRKKREWLRDHAEANPATGGDHNCIPGDILYPYCGEDCSYTFKLDSYLVPLLKEMGRYEKPFLFPLMYHNQTAEYLEKNGLNLDMDKNEHLLDEFPKRMKELEGKLRSFPEFHKLEKMKKRELMYDLYQRVLGYKKQVPDVKKKTISLYSEALSRMEEKKEEWINFTDADKRILIYGFIGLDKDKTPKPLVEGFMDLPIDENELTPTKMPTVKTEILEKFRKKPSMLTLILRRAEYFSAESKYVSPIRDWCGTDGRTHTSYLVHGQDTGRVSSEKPNHENLMKRGDKWIVQNVREQFVPTNDDYILCKADLMQSELRLLADRAKDKVMIQEFNDGKDPHRMAAAAGYQITEEEVTDEQRTKAKSAVSFGLVYGRQARALSQDMGWSLRKGQEFIDRYFGKYHGIREYLDEESDRLRKVKFSISHFGRIRPAERELDSDNQGIVERAIRQLINAPIQGDSSDWVWVSAYRLMKWLKKHRMKTKLVIVEHDANYLDLFRKEADDVLPKLLSYMTDREYIYEKTGWMLSVPMDIDVAGGKTLSDKFKFIRRGQTFLLPREIQ